MFWPTEKTRVKKLACTTSSVIEQIVLSQASFKWKDSFRAAAKCSATYEQARFTVAPPKTVNNYCTHPHKGY